MQKQSKEDKTILKIDQVTIGFSILMNNTVLILSLSQSVTWLIVRYTYLSHSILV